MATNNKTCPSCGKSVSARHLQRHVDEVHSLKRHVYRCPVCDHEEVDTRRDQILAHLTRMHPSQPVAMGLLRVSVAPYYTFRHCLVPGCRYRTVEGSRMSAHMTAKHPAWSGPTSTQTTTAAPTTQTATSTVLTGTAPSTTAATTAVAATMPTTASPSTVTMTTAAPATTSIAAAPTASTTTATPALMPIPTVPRRCTSDVRERRPMPRPNLVVKANEKDREVSFPARDFRYFDDQGQPRAIPLVTTPSTEVTPITSAPVVSLARPADQTMRAITHGLETVVVTATSTRVSTSPDTASAGSLTLPPPQQDAPALVADVFTTGPTRRWVGTLLLGGLIAPGPNRLVSMCGPANVAASFSPAP